MNRRAFIRSAACLLAAPAIVRAASLMPVRVWRPDIYRELTRITRENFKEMLLASNDLAVFGTSLIFQGNDGRVKRLDPRREAIDALNACYPVLQNQARAA